MLPYVVNLFLNYQNAPLLSHFNINSELSSNVPTDCHLGTLERVVTEMTALQAKSLLHGLT